MAIHAFIKFKRNEAEQNLDIRKQHIEVQNYIQREGQQSKHMLPEEDC